MSRPEYAHLRLLHREDRVPDALDRCALILDQLPQISTPLTQDEPGSMRAQRESFEANLSEISMISRRENLAALRTLTASTFALSSLSESYTDSPSPKSPISCAEMSRGDPI